MHYRRDINVCAVHTDMIFHIRAEAVSCIICFLQCLAVRPGIHQPLPLRVYSRSSFPHHWSITNAPPPTSHLQLSAVPVAIWGRRAIFTLCDLIGFCSWAWNGAIPQPTFRAACPVTGLWAKSCSLSQADRQIEPAHPQTPLRTLLQDSRLSPVLVAGQAGRQSPSPPRNELLPFRRNLHVNLGSLHWTHIAFIVVWEKTEMMQWKEIVRPPTCHPHTPPPPRTLTLLVRATIHKELQVIFLFTWSSIGSCPTILIFSRNLGFLCRHQQAEGYKLKDNLRLDSKLTSPDCKPLAAHVPVRDICSYIHLLNTVVPQ